MHRNPTNPPAAADPPPARRPGFFEDFRRFFLRGLATLLPTLITISLLLWVWDLLWNNIGRYILLLIQEIWVRVEPTVPLTKVRFAWSEDSFKNRLIGVLLAILLIYIVGVFVGNLIGRTAWRLGERAVMRMPLIRAIYPAVKQVTDFLLAERKHAFAGSRVVAVHARDPDVWSIGLVTGTGLRRLNQAVDDDMATVFIPSSPTAFSGYVVVVPRDRLIELPLTVEEAMRLLISGGVISPDSTLRPDAAGLGGPAGAGGQKVLADAPEAEGKGIPDSRAAVPSPHAGANLANP